MVKVMTPISSLSQIWEQVKNTVLVNVAVPCTKTEILRYWKGSVIEHKQWKTFIIYIYLYLYTYIYIYIYILTMWVDYNN